MQTVATSTVLAQAGRLPRWLKETFIVLGASVLMALAAPISIRLPFSPVPIALHIHMALFLGALLGSRRGALAMIAYIMQGAFGLPVFAGGAAGLAVLLGPTGGYILSYIAVAFLSGLFLERMKAPTALKRMGALAAANLAVYPLGVLCLLPYVGSLKMALLVGFVPFIPGDLLKLVLVCKALPKKN